MKEFKEYSSGSKKCQLLHLASVASIGMGLIILNCTDTSKYGKKCQRVEFFLCRLFLLFNRHVCNASFAQHACQF